MRYSGSRFLCWSAGCNERARSRSFRETLVGLLPKSMVLFMEFVYVFWEYPGPDELIWTRDGIGTSGTQMDMDLGERCMNSLESASSLFVPSDKEDGRLTKEV